MLKTIGSFRSQIKIWGYLFLASAACTSPSYANLTPIIQDSKTIVGATISPEDISFKQLAQNTQPDSDRTTIKVEKIEVTGNTVLQAEIQSIIQPLEGKTVTREKLQQAAAEITARYMKEGFITSNAVLVEESLVTGVIKIQVTEGTLAMPIEVEGTQRLNPDYVRSRVNLGVSIPVNINKLEDQLRLLRANPLFDNIEASLKPGEEGKSILVVKVTEANPLIGNFGSDNYSPPSVGGERFILDLGYRNLSGIGGDESGIGDEIFVSYRPRVQTIAGTYRLEFGYRVPVNAMDGSIALRASIDRNEVIEESFEPLDISGESGRYNITYRQPFIRTPREEFALSFGFTYRGGQTFTAQGPTPFLMGPDEDGISRTSVFELGQEYTRREEFGAWAFRSQFRLGTGIFDATNNPSPIPDGQFFSWLLQSQRVQVLNEDNFLIIQADLQLTPDGLLPSEQFVIGGGQSVRGYRQNVRSGDNGFRFLIEDRITVARDPAGRQVFTVAPFFNMGSVWNVGDNPNPQFSQRFIAGLGLGLLWQPIDGLNIRLDYAPPLIDLKDRGNNVQDDGFYFSVNYQL